MGRKLELCKGKVPLNIEIKYNIQKLVMVEDEELLEKGLRFFIQTINFFKP